jgi:hypothetical protein
MPRSTNTKKQRVSTLSHKDWSQTMQRHIEAEVEKYQKEKTVREKQHETEKRHAVWDAYGQAFKAVQHELHTMLERQVVSLELYADVGRVLVAVRGRFFERYDGLRREESGQ